MGARRKGRELALQALYQLEITDDHSEPALRRFCESFEASEAAQEFAMELVRGIVRRRAEIDRLIADACEHWRLERLSRIDLNIIRVAVHEMTGEPAVPVEIAINEAIEIARRYGTVESATFVNGVLDQAAARLGLKRSREAKGVPGEE